MIILTKENILSYIKEHVPSLQLKEPVKVSMIGEGDLGEDVEGDGYCNYVFRVSDADGHSYIVKQSTEHLKRRGRALTPTRNRFEYEIMELRAKIVPQYVPALYLGDPENNVFIMEDVSNLKLIRFQMNKNHLFPELAKQGAQYLAATHFYTSEFYLPTEEYRKLLAHFMNAELRVVMENGIFLNIFGADQYDPYCGPEFEEYCKSIRFDPNLEFQRYKLRHLFMSKSETLIHGDFHTSNIFADDTHLKVIDMEYTFGAPFSYDLGFIILFPRPAPHLSAHLIRKHIERTMSLISSPLSRCSILTIFSSSLNTGKKMRSLNIRLQMAIKKALLLIFYENALALPPA